MYQYINTIVKIPRIVIYCSVYEKIVRIHMDCKSHQQQQQIDVERKPITAWNKGLDWMVTNFTSIFILQ